MVIAGGLLILWGAFVVYSSIFKMRKQDVKDDSRVGSSWYIELEVLSKLANNLPYGLAKGLIAFIGFSFMALGSWMVY
ncbi:hypothetical protein [Jeotgalibacillus proteolyticus]|uniref:Uncharacterized protein n=1 Tax=Jeotgalibacillus proteolyticus TaxID=2082395 RepID=A0A2S5GBL3_9BACL|nr:hypothetical protein [Jeotgalibacillus proteolyticus]PPA70348.1 hypothetical protein C4B60_12275 [Jeotgalibacillus proteolyticus]